MSVKSKEVGFTLIEVMLAMTLLSIMMVLLFSSLRVAAESWNKGETKIAQVNQKAVVYQFFKRHIPSIQPLWDDFSQEQRIFAFQGERDKLRFVSTLPVSSGHKGLQVFEVFFQPSEQGSIKIRLTPFFPTLTGESWQMDEVVLLDNVVDFKLAYFDSNSNSQDVGVWNDSWQEKNSLPRLLKINITLTGQSTWSEMIFSLNTVGFEE